MFPQLTFVSVKYSKNPFVNTMNRALNSCIRRELNEKLEGENMLSYCVNCVMLAGARHVARMGEKERCIQDFGGET
jgi:hypothetical protein